MHIVISRISRKNGEPCTQADLDTVIPLLPNRQQHLDRMNQLQTEGKVIYRSGSITDDGRVETVTLWDSKASWDAHFASQEYALLAENIRLIYTEAEITEEDVG